MGPKCVMVMVSSCFIWPFHIRKLRSVDWEFWSRRLHSSWSGVILSNFAFRSIMRWPVKQLCVSAFLAVHSAILVMVSWSWPEKWQVILNRKVFSPNCVEILTLLPVLFFISLSACFKGATPSNCCDGSAGSVWAGLVITADLYCVVTNCQQDGRVATCIVQKIGVTHSLRRDII